MNKILVSPSSFGQCGLRPIEILKENGFEVIENPYGRKLTEAETKELANDVIGVVAGIENYDKEVLDHLSTLQCISRVGVGVDSIDLEYAKEKGVEVLNTPNGPTHAVAELSIALAFDLLRQVSYSDRMMRKGQWKKSIGRLIDKKKVGIIGLGRIGKAVATLYKALGCQVFAYDLFPDIEWCKTNDVHLKSMNDLLRESEIISIHVSSPSDGKAMIGEGEFSILRSDVILINLARGGVMDESYLYKFLQENPNANAALDVFGVEPYSGELLDLENIVFTPHLGSYAKEAKLGMEIQAVENLIEFLGS